MEESPHQPHDKLFKLGFRNPVNAAEFLRHQIPAELATVIDWQSLASQPGTYVDSQFHNSESDLLFRAHTNEGDISLYLLFEHQRDYDPWIPLRLLRYMVRIWEMQLKEGYRSLLPIIPVVVAQNEHHWELQENFAALFPAAVGQSRDWQAFLPDFLFCLVQLADLPFDRIQGTSEGILTMRILKAERENQLLADAVWDESMIRSLSHGFFEQLLNYIGLVGQIDKPAFLKKLESIEDPEIKSAMSTLAQQFRQEGRLEGERLLFQRLLARKFGDLDYPTLEKLNLAGQEELELWGERILEAKTLPEVFEG